jgi:hypothetical protein
MLFDRDSLAFKALVALDEVQEQCGGGPVQPSYALRFTLAWLYSASDGTRWVYDDFWRNIQEKHEKAYSDAQAGYMRGTAARSGMQGIGRTLGIPWTPNYVEALRHVRKPKELRDREWLAQALKKAHQDRLEWEEQRRKGKECGFRR